MPFNGALTPGQRDGGVDGGPVCPKPSGEAPEGWEGALGSARQPGLQLSRLALADEGDEVLRQGRRFRELGRLLAELRELVAIV